MRDNLTPICPPHLQGSDVWRQRCTRCGVRLLEGGISAEMLVGRVEALVQSCTLFATGRIRGQWIEVLEEDDESLSLFAYWVRPARNIVGYEAISSDNPDPTGEELGALFLAELAGFGGTKPQVSAGASTKAAHKPSRWQRFRRWCGRNWEAEFACIAVPLCLIEAAVLGIVLGLDGIQGVFSAVWSVLF